MQVVYPNLHAEDPDQEDPDQGQAGETLRLLSLEVAGAVAVLAAAIALNRGPAPIRPLSNSTGTVG